MVIDLALLIHLFNFLLFSIAVSIALRMPQASDMKLVRLLMAAAFVLMAVSPLLDLYGHLARQGQSMLEASDLLTTFSSALILAGVNLLRPIIAERYQDHLKLHRQLDELQRFHRLAVGRELRMKELVAENEQLRHQLEHADTRKEVS
ncbi:MAG: hypothetical protein ABII81_01460 [Pseudomonadota bacterium]